jgi:hypothetical protein
MAKIYTIRRTQVRTGNSTTMTGTVEELVKQCSYTLESGASYSQEKGNSKINQMPKTINSLVSNLNKSVNNSAANGYTGVSYTVV